MKTKPNNGHATANAEDFVPLYFKGLELIAELQKKTLELAAQQNHASLEAGEKAVNRFVPATQVKPFFDVTAQAFDAVLGAEKDVIDLVIAQNQTLSGFTQEGAESLSRTATGLAELFRKTIECSVAVQKKSLEFAAEQNKRLYQTAEQQVGIPETPAVELFRRGLDALLETQKAVLDVASQPLKAGAKAA